MKAHWTDLAVAVVLAGAGCAAIYAGLVRILRRVVAERQEETDRQIDALRATLKALQLRVAEMGLPEAEKAEAGEVSAISGAAENMAGQESSPLKPETLAVMTAATTAFLGKKARLRSAQPLPAMQDTAGAWAQQGRVLVQTSHNLRA